MLVEKKILSDHFEEIYVSWFSRMKYFALEYVVSEEDAENIVQDVFTESLELFDQSLLSEQDIERIITEVVDSLPKKCREIFIKSKIEGKKQKDIAAELNISLKTVENQMAIAYKKIKSELKDYLPLLIFLLAN